MLDYIADILRIYLTHLPVVKFDSLQDLEKFCLLHNIFVTYREFAFGRYYDSVLKIFGFFDQETLTNLAVQFEGTFINHLTHPLDFDCSRLKSADRQGTRPQIRNQPTKFVDKITCEQVHTLLSKVAIKLK